MVQMTDLLMATNPSAMKPYIFLFIVLLAACPEIQAQDYCNLINSGTAYYSGLTVQPGLLSGVGYESATATGNGDTLFLAINTIRPMTPPGTLLDTTGGILGRNIEKLSNGWFRFYTAAGDTILLNTGAVVNGTWKFINLPQNGRLMATCTSIQPETFLGVTDTVKTFTFQAKDAGGANIAHYFNGKTIRLSRRFGLVQFYDLYRMPESTDLYTLEGRSQPAIGFQGLTWHDVYDYNIGDVFHIKKHDNYQLTSQHYTDDYYTIKTVTAKQVAVGGGTVTYTFDYCKATTGFSFSQGYVTSYSIGNMQESYPYTNQPAGNSSGTVPCIFNTSGTQFYTTLQGIGLEHPATGEKYNYYACCWMENPAYSSHIYEEEFTRGVGRNHWKQWTLYNWEVYYDYEDLVYFKKGSEEWGTPIYIDCNTMIPSFTVSPASLTLGYLPGDTATMHIVSNSSWSLHIPPGDTKFQFSQLNGSGNANVLVTTSDTNTTLGLVVTVVQITIGNNSTVKYYSVMQSPNPAPYFESHPDTLVLGWEWGSYTEDLFITTNQPWSISNVGWPSWANASATSGTGGALVEFTAGQSHNGAGNRVANLVIETPAGNHNLCLVQSGRYGTGIGQAQTGGITVFPNPARSSIRVTLSGFLPGSEKSVALYDLTGRKVFSARLDGNDYLFDAGKLNPGMYIVKLSDPDWTVLAIQKLIIE